MPAKDLFHDAVRNGLEKDGWTILSDSLKLELEKQVRMYVDLAAGKTFAVRKDDRKIAVEVKSFVGKSLIEDFHYALGQFLNYRLAMEMLDMDYELYLAVPLDAYQSFFQRRLVQKIIQTYGLKLIVYHP